MQSEFNKISKFYVTITKRKYNLSMSYSLNSQPAETNDQRPVEQQQQSQQQQQQKQQQKVADFFKNLLSAHKCEPVKQPYH